MSDFPANKDYYQLEIMKSHVCTWRQDADANWHTECDMVWVSNDSLDAWPRTRGFNYCFRCGKVLRAVKYVEPVAKEDLKQATASDMRREQYERTHAHRDKNGDIMDGIPRATEGRLTPAEVSEMKKEFDKATAEDVLTVEILRKAKDRMKEAWKIEVQRICNDPEWQKQQWDAFPKVVYPRPETGSVNKYLFCPQCDGDDRHMMDVACPRDQLP